VTELTGVPLTLLTSPMHPAPGSVLSGHQITARGVGASGWRIGGWVRALPREGLTIGAHP
jgi:hypothetical protein